MAKEIVDWGSLGGSDGNGDGPTFFKFEAGKTYKFRPVGSAVDFFKFFIKTKEGNRSVCVDQEDVQSAATLIEEHVGYAVKPVHRYAINVIDREDSKLKVLEAGMQIFEKFGTWAQGSGLHPGSTGGGDWVCTVTGEGLNRSYSASFLQPAALTADEMKMLEAEKGKYVLSEIYKACPLDDIIHKVFGDNSPGQSSAPVPAPAEALKSAQAGSADALQNMF